MRHLRRASRSEGIVNLNEEQRLNPGAKEKVRANRNVPERNHRERRGWKIPRLALGAVGTEDCGGRTTLDWWALAPTLTAFPAKMKSGVPRLPILSITRANLEA